MLGKDGRFSISGVSAGDYDLALRLYEPPGDGCLVNPVGAKVIHFQVSEEAARGTAIDLGEIPVKVTLGPRRVNWFPTSRSSMPPASHAASVPFAGAMSWSTSGPRGAPGALPACPRLRSFRPSMERMITWRFWV